MMLVLGGSSATSSFQKYKVINVYPSSANAVSGTIWPAPHKAQLSISARLSKPMRSLHLFRLLSLTLDMVVAASPI